MTSDSQISEREREILRLVATGATNQQIAQQLNISANTVKVHLRNIFGKIGAASRTEATLYAVRTGLVRVGEAPALPVLGEAKADESAAAPLVIIQPPLDAAPVPVAERAFDGLSYEDQAPHSLGRDERAVRGLSRRWLWGAGALAALLAVAALVIVARPAPLSQPTPAAPTAAGVALPAPAQRWRELAPMPAGRAGFALANYSDNGRPYLYVIGGDLGGKTSDEVLRYDPSADVWASWGKKPTGVSDVQAAVVGNKIYVPGGRLASGAITDIFEVYDPQNNRWTALKRLPEPRSGYALAAVEGKLYLFGGWDGSTYSAEVWQYNPDQNEWSERKPMPTARAFAGAAALEGQVYIVGGEGKDGALTVNERYTPSDDAGGGSPWTTQQPLPAPRSHIAITGANGRIFVVGGADSNGQLFVYNNSWQPQEIPLGVLRDLRAQALGDKLYIVGGQGATASARAYEYHAIYIVVVPMSSGGPGTP
ncbi:MAG TPA: kelch repeat-containing protein [Roseiflexaceae bacterium]